MVKVRVIAYDHFTAVYSLKARYLGGVCGTQPHKHPPFYPLRGKKHGMKFLQDENLFLKLCYNLLSIS